MSKNLEHIREAFSNIDYELTPGTVKPTVIDQIMKMGAKTQAQTIQAIDPIDYEDNVVKFTRDNLGLTSTFSDDELNKLNHKAEYLKLEFEGFASDEATTRRNFILAIKELSSSDKPEEQYIAAIALAKIAKVAEASIKPGVKDFAKELRKHHKEEIKYYNIDKLQTAVGTLTNSRKALDITHNYFAPGDRLSEKDAKKYEAQSDLLAYKFLQYSKNPQSANTDFIKTIKSLTESESKEDLYLAAITLDKIEMISRRHKNKEVRECYSDLMANHRKMEVKGYEKLEEQGFATHDFFRNHEYGAKKYSPAVTNEITMDYQSRYENYPLKTKLERLEYYKRDLKAAATELDVENSYPNKFIYHARCESMDTLISLEINTARVAKEGLTPQLQAGIKKDVTTILAKHTSPEDQALLKKHMDYLIEKEMKAAGVSTAKKTKVESVKDFFNGIVNLRGRYKASSILKKQGLKISSFVEKEKLKQATETEVGASK